MPATVLKFADRSVGCLKGSEFNSAGVVVRSGNPDTPPGFTEFQLDMASRVVALTVCDPRSCDAVAAGRLILDFKRPSHLDHLVLAACDEGGRLYIFDADGGLAASRDLPVLRAGHCEQLWFGLDNIGRVECLFFGHGALSSLSFDAPAAGRGDAKVIAFKDFASVPEGRTGKNGARKGDVGAKTAASQGRKVKRVCDAASITGAPAGSVSAPVSKQDLRIDAPASRRSTDLFLQGWTSASDTGRTLVGRGSQIGSDIEKSEKTVPCFTPGTSIATPKGEYLVEDLQVGDKVITRDNGIQEIRWIGARRMDGRELQANPHLRPILIQQGSLGHGLPERDMLVSPNHRMLVGSDRVTMLFDETEVLVAAKHLINPKGGIQTIASMGTTYIHFMFDRHEVVLANGAWTESFQPADYTLKGMGNAQRTEVFELFPELQGEKGKEAFASARRTLKKYQAKMLFQ